VQATNPVIPVIHLIGAMSPDPFRRSAQRLSSPASRNGRWDKITAELTRQLSADSFSEDAAREAAAHWGFGADADVTLICVSENATYLVSDARAIGPAVLRLSRPGYHRLDALASELAWTAALRKDAVVGTPEWFPTLTGRPVALVADPTPAPARHAVLFGHVAGEHPAAADPAAGLEEIGELAARLHSHARGWRPPEGFTRFSWDLTAALGNGTVPGRWGDWRAATPAAGRPVLEAAERRVRQVLTAYGRDPDRFGLIHADLRAANLLIAPPAADVTVIDFDDCGYSWYLYDLAASVSFLEHRPELPAMVAQWLAGYARIAGLGSADLAAVPSLIMLRRLQLQAWAGSHAETDMVRSLGPDFAAGTVEVARRYLSAGLLAGLS
jgi:Ser/Thr protein kinase RdoA (MazF antagonist)